MSADDPAQLAARKIQERYRSFRKKRELAGLALSKTDWNSLLSKVDTVLRTSQFEEAQPKKLSVRGKWIRGLGSAGAIGRVRLCLCLACLFKMQQYSLVPKVTYRGYFCVLQGSADGGGGLLLRKEHWSVC